MARVMGVWDWDMGGRFSSMGGLSARGLDVLEPQAKWFYATQYISSVSLADRDLKRRTAIILPKFSIHTLVCP